MRAYGQWFPGAKGRYSSRHHGVRHLFDESAGESSDVFEQSMSHSEAPGIPGTRSTMALRLK